MALLVILWLLLLVIEVCGLIAMVVALFVHPHLAEFLGFLCFFGFVGLVGGAGLIGFVAILFPELLENINSEQVNISAPAPGVENRDARRAEQFRTDQCWTGERRDGPRWSNVGRPVRPPNG